MGLAQLLASRPIFSGGAPTSAPTQGWPKTLIAEYFLCGSFKSYFHDLIARLYMFKPHSLSKNGHCTKSAFWKTDMVRNMDSILLQYQSSKILHIPIPNAEGSGSGKNLRPHPRPEVTSMRGNGASIFCDASCAEQKKIWEGFAVKIMKMTHVPQTKTHQNSTMRPRDVRLTNQDLSCSG